MKKFNFWSLLLLIPFSFGLVVALTECLGGFERSIHEILKNTFYPTLDKPFIWLTELGDTIGVVAVTLLVFVISAITRKYFFTVGLPVVVTVILSRVVNVILKAVVDRPRPNFWADRFAPDETSFPSGHSQNNVALYIGLLLVLLLVIKSVKWRVTLSVILITIPVLIGITRLYVGVHYMSDVIAGWSMGALVAIIINYFYFKIYYSIKDKKDAKA